MFRKVAFAFIAFFVVASEAQTCTAALSFDNGTYACPDTLTLSGTQCCESSSSTGDCSPALTFDNGTYACPDTLTLSGTQCCSSTTTTNTTTTNSTCVDLVNARTGVSDCPSRAYLCNNTTYYTLMVRSLKSIIFPSSGDLRLFLHGC